MWWWRKTRSPAAAPPPEVEYLPNGEVWVVCRSAAEARRALAELRRRREEYAPAPRALTTELERMRAEFCAQRLPQLDAAIAQLERYVDEQRRPPTPPRPAPSGPGGEPRRPGPSGVGDGDRRLGWASA
jgi:hypothetical protein